MRCLALAILIFVSVFYPTFLSSTCAQENQFEGQSSVDANSASAKIQELVSLLDSVSYRERHDATNVLGTMGFQVFDHATKAMENASPEKAVRIAQVLKKIISQSKIEDYSKVSEALQNWSDSSQQALGIIPQDGLVQDLDPVQLRNIQKLLQEFTDATEEQSEKILNAELTSEILGTKGFRIVKKERRMGSNSFKALSDVNAHQEILMYRVRWLNGQWSRWYLPGVNDHLARLPGERCWNCFPTHEHEILEIEIPFGELSNRSGFFRLPIADQ